MVAYADNAAVIEFYKALGYALDPVVSLGKRLEHDQQHAGEKQGHNKLCHHLKENRAH